MTYKLLPAKIEEKTVTEVQERVITRTRIIERPDGTTETIIDKDEKRDVTKTAEKAAIDDISVFVAISGYSATRDEPTYTLGVSKEVFLGIKAGAYARTDKEVGVVFSYSF